MGESQNIVDVVEGYFEESGPIRMKWDDLAGILEDRQGKHSSGIGLSNERVYFAVLREAEKKGILTSNESGRFSVYSLYGQLMNPWIPLEKTYFFTTSGEVNEFARTVLAANSPLRIKHILEVHEINNPVLERYPKRSDWDLQGGFRHVPYEAD